MSPGHEGKEEKLVMWLSNSFGHHSIFFPLSVLWLICTITIKEKEKKKKKELVPLAISSGMLGCL